MGNKTRTPDLIAVSDRNKLGRDEMMYEESL